jgi:hypothetical protein
VVALRKRVVALRVLGGRPSEEGGSSSEEESSPPRRESLAPRKKQFILFCRTTYGLQVRASGGIKWACQKRFWLLR